MHASRGGRAAGHRRTHRLRHHHRLRGLADVRIEPAQTAELQRNWCGRTPPAWASHSPPRWCRPCCCSEPTPGGWPVRRPPDVVELLIGMLNREVHPVVPSRGSVGASGDLAPLAHLALVVIESERRGSTTPDRSAAAEALERAGLLPLTLEAKEGLALLNGTQLMGATKRLALEDARRLAVSADVIGAMSAGGHAGHRLRLRSGPDRGAAASRQAWWLPTCGRCSTARRSALRMLRAATGAGRLLAALHAAGPRRGARRARPAGARAERGDERRHRQPARLPQAR